MAPGPHMRIPGDSGAPAGRAPGRARSALARRAVRGAGGEALDVRAAEGAERRLLAELAQAQRAVDAEPVAAAAHRHVQRLVQADACARARRVGARPGKQASPQRRHSWVPPQPVSNDRRAPVLRHFTTHSKKTGSYCTGVKPAIHLGAVSYPAYQGSLSTITSRQSGHRDSSRRFVPTWCSHRPAANEHTAVLIVALELVKARDGRRAVDSGLRGRARRAAPRHAPAGRQPRSLTLRLTNKSLPSVLTHLQTAYEQLHLNSHLDGLRRAWAAGALCMPRRPP